MQTINYAEKYSDVIDERFTLGSLTEKALNNRYNFDGVNKINVYSVDTVPLVDYNMKATFNRYGIPEELGNDVQSMELTQDKAFTFTIDKRNLDDTMMANSAGLALRREIDEVVTPTVVLRKNLCKNENCSKKQCLAEQSFFAAPIFYSI